MFAEIDKAISRYVSFNEEELDFFHTLLLYRKVPKKTVLLRAGDECPFEAFVIRGCIRKYCIDAQGTEVTLQFAIEESWVGDISFTSEDPKPSQVFIETLEECELLELAPEKKEFLFEKAPRFERAFRILMQRHLAVTQQRLFNTIVKNGEEKYRDFLEHYPSIPQRVPQHYIASYLGISPEFLSKIRSRR